MSADGADGADGADDALFAEQASTSLYERIDGSGEKHVLPLTRAQPTYCAVEDTAAQASGSKDESQPEIVVQVRKRKGKLQIFLDGYHSEGTLDKARNGVDVRLHKLNWHRGLHEDVQTDTRVFSPLAIVAAIEDGQRPVQDVTVSVWTTFENQQVPVFEGILVAETRVVPHRVTNARCNTVRAPYPLAYPPPPSLTIFDRMRIERQNAHQILNTAKTSLGKALNSTKKDYLKQIKTSGSGRREDWSELTEWSVWLKGFTVTAAYNWARGLAGYEPVPENTADAGLAGSDLTSRALYRGMVQGGAALITTALRFYNFHFWSAVALATVPRAYDLWRGGGGDEKSHYQYRMALDIAWDTMKIYMGERPPKSEGQTKFSIKELARTIFSLSVMRTPVTTHTLPDEYRRQRSEQFRREQVVWEWLRDVNNEITAPDLTMLDVSTMFATRLHVRIAVDDALNCSPSEAYHEITCGRDDCYELGALAAGTLRDIESLFEAMEALEKTLDAGIANPDKPSTWWDWALLLPQQVLLSASEQFKVLREGYNKMRKAVEEKKDANALVAFDEAHADDLAQIEGYEEAINAEEKTDAEIEKEREDAQKQAKAQQAEEEKQAKEDAKGDKELLQKKVKAAAERAARAILKVQIRAFWKITGRQLRQMGVAALANISSPAKEKRKKVLQAVKKGLHEKLAHMFLSQGQQGAMLYEKLCKVAEDKRVPVPIVGACQYARRLPHRATSDNTKRLFLFRADRSNGFVDVTTRAAATRVFSEYYDANQLIAATMDASATAMHRLVREWEANSPTRVKLVCMCKDVQEQNPFRERVAFSTLVLTTPVDVQAAETLAEMTERERRQIRLVVRRAQQRGDKSALERLGLTHDNTSLLLTHVFGNLWTDELVTLHKLGTKAQQVQMLEQASRRATARLRAAGKLILDLLTVHNPTSNAMEFDDVPCNATDVALLATQRGRDAGLIIERLLFGKNFVAIRAAFAPLLRVVAQAARRCADAFDRDIPERLPYEPVTSLFDRDCSGGVAAYLRVQRMSSLGDVVSAAAAAYPSVLLLGSDGASQQAAIALANAQGVPEAPAGPNLRFEEVVRTMRYRLASLKMDELPVDGVDAADVDQLALELSSTSLLAASHSFYVPFGFGDARPPPTLPPLSAPMFGSVPVYGPHLTRAFAALRTMGGKAKRPYRVTLKPTFGCLTPLSNDEGASAHPNVVQVLATGEDGGVEVRYTASRVWGVDLPNRDTRYSNAQEAAAAHLQGEDAARLTADVCAVAWNAERVMQAVIAALGSASNEPGAHDGLLLRLVLPHEGGEQSVWFTKPNNPIALQARRAYAARKARFAKLVLYHRGIDHQKLARDLWGYLKKQKAMDDAGLKKLEDDLSKSDLGALDTNADKVLQKSTERQGVLLALEGNIASFANQAAEVVENKGAGPAAAFEDDSDIVREKTTAKLNNFYKDLKAVLGVIGTLDAAYRDASERAARATAKGGVSDVNDPNAPTARAGLVCALGVGMGMLSPLLGDNVPMQVETVQVTAEDDKSPLLDWADENGAQKALEGAFGKCDAMRMSEACLVVVGVLSNL